VQAGLDYDVIRDELEVQIDRLGDDKFATFANEALIELEERYGVTTPIEDRVQDLTDRYYRGLEVLQELGEPMTVDELAAELELAADEVHYRIAYLETFERVHRDGDTVRPVGDHVRWESSESVTRLMVRSVSSRAARTR